MGHDVFVYFFPYEVFLSDTYENQGVKIYQIGCQIPRWTKKRIWGRFAKILRLLEWYPTLSMQNQVVNHLEERIAKDRIELVESTSNRGLLARYCKGQNRPPVCTRVSTTMRSAYDNSKKNTPLNYKIEGRFEYSQIRNSDSLVTHTASHAHVLEDELNIAKARFHLIPHGIEIPHDSNLAINNSCETLRILFVGRLERRKGIEVLIKTIPLVLEKNPNVIFQIVGDDPQGIANDFTIPADWSQKVQFLGKVSKYELQQRYKECNIFIAPSFYESFGLIFAEAMAWAKPVIGTKVGGIPDVVTDNDCGFLVEPGNPAALASSILKLSDSPDLRSRMGTNGRKRIKDFFSIKAMTEMSVEHYQKLLSK